MRQSWLPSRKRRRQVTNERVYIAPEMVGLRLAAFWKRGIALLLDASFVLLLMIAGLVTYPVALIVTANPGFVSAVLESGADLERNPLLTVETARLIARREAECTPEPIRAAVRNRDDAALTALLAENAADIDIDEGGNIALRIVTKQDDDSETVMMETVILPTEKWPRFLGFAAFFLAYFTLWPRLLSGRTPGKLLFGLRVARLDGKRLGLWDTFSRAGGYGASVSMLALGFFEAIWDPNRQAVHDKIAGTVVVVAKPWPPSNVSRKDAQRHDPRTPRVV